MSSYIGRSSDGFGILRKYRWVASGSETSIAPTLADSNGKLLRFTDKNLVHLFLNGVKLDQTDFNLNTTNQISGLAALAANDILEAHVYDVFSIATTDTVSATDGGTFSGAITANGGAVFNEDSADVDFRVESNGDANMLFVEGGTNMIGIKTNDPKEVMDVRGALVVSGDHATNSNAQGSAHGVMLSSTSGTGYVSPISNSTNDVDLTLRALNGGSFENRLVLDSEGDVTVSTGNLVIGTAGKGIDFSAQTAASAASASATGELFDRYEEGIFTHAGNANMTINAISARGFYQIVGNRCFVNGFVRFTHSGSNNVYLTLPVASKADITSPANGENESATACFFPSVETSGGLGGVVIAYVGSGSGTIFFYNLGTSFSLINNNNLASTAEVYYNLNYVIA